MTVLQVIAIVAYIGVPVAVGVISNHVGWYWTILVSVVALAIAVLGGALPRTYLGVAEFINVVIPHVAEVLTPVVGIYLVLFLAGRYGVRLSRRAGSKRLR